MSVLPAVRNLLDEAAIHIAAALTEALEMTADSPEGHRMALVSLIDLCQDKILAAVNKIDLTSEEDHDE